MTKKTGIRVLTGLVMAFTAAAISFGALTVSWFLGPNVLTKDDNFLDGDVGLRNYFYSGDGSQTRPYEIVSPIHFYNLTRLQNLGIFPEKKYFQIGHTFHLDGEDVVRCINSYDNEGNPIYSKYLDMNEFSHERNVMTIGGEGSPFVGVINGNGIPIKDLRVCGNPEDVGVFGYVAHEGSLTGLVFENLEVKSLGYNNTVGDDDYILFSEDIDDIFNSSSYLATDTSLKFYDYNSSSSTYDSVNLKKLNGVAGTQLLNINADDRLVTNTDIYNGYFQPVFPHVENDRFTYSFRSSSPLIKEVTDLHLNGQDSNIVMDLSQLHASEAFNTGTNTQADAKIYLVASVEVDGYTFSRVIQSYTIEFYSNGHLWAEKQYGAGIYCDYIVQGDETDRNTHYHHGNNIGLIAGHVDGNLNDCFVFNGKFTFNDTGYHPILAETDTALVGEIGSNVANALEPEIGLVVNGDIGIMNFSKIYSMIRTDMTKGSVVKAGQRTPTGGTSVVNYISYKNFINTETIDNFKDYLRYYDGKKDENEFITMTGTSMYKSTDTVWHDYTTPTTIPTDFNSVDFLWNKVIEDDKDSGVDRGLGVFKVVSSYNSAAKTNPYGQYMVNNIGECRIINGTPKTKVYFSTAEVDRSKYSGWRDGGPLRATTIPSYSDVGSFGYQFARDYNYVFELDLSQMDAAGGKDYMYNTDNPFLVNYLNSRLIDKFGAPVTPGSSRFGFMFRSSENEILSSLSSYMPVKTPGTKHNYGTDEDPVYYPSNSIVFAIDNPNGANVSVVGNGADITIYGYDPTTESGGTTALYTMKSSNVGDSDSHRYFTYDVATGETGTETVQNGNGMGDGGALYGHIFKLPQGNYVLGSNGGTANVYFLAVQGQTDASIGGNDVISLGDAIEDVDFLLEAPTLEDYPLGLTKALFSYRGEFNLSSGNIVMDVITVSNKKYMRLTFPTNPTFLTYMLTYSRHTEHTYYINGDAYDAVNYTYRP